ncbi:DUF4349 domain-containing protein [Glycomyces sp. TRM65418]|uniref:DUF4349 domain-containing protein n=1 Tax=Glycomyces sp. TRM65418 TaxID=2867006 RepID=UPI001CE4FAF5|nr:DUF4349 domain-containing protein [Glycomyces sp. TRM65418]MCC3763085.1 DUF4349 domain-containing protein [Glycomyces sp. TRM65418]QZD57096.1 DUF4349 domain-containing protein [Glycomyces sp. TRM65418]
MRLLRYTAALAAASLLLFGCSANGDNASSGGAEPADLDEHAAPEAADVEAEGGTPPAQVETADRAVIYEAALSVQDADPEAVAEAAWDLAESFGGFVTADERDRKAGDEGGYDRAHLILRIPSEHFSEAMEGLAALGDEELYRSVSTEDVTEAAVDLAAHIATKSASVDRVRGLLAEATSVNAILELEAELAEREGELASLQSQLNGLEDRVALSTVEFNVYQPSAKESGTGAAKAPDSFSDGLGVGFSAAVGLLVGLSVVVGVLLPFLPLAAVVAAAIVLPIRWARRRRAAGTAAPTRAEAAAGPTHG